MYSRITGDGGDLGDDDAHTPAETVTAASLSISRYASLLLLVCAYACTVVCRYAGTLLSPAIRYVALSSCAVGASPKICGLSTGYCRRASDRHRMRNCETDVVG